MGKSLSKQDQARYEDCFAWLMREGFDFRNEKSSGWGEPLTVKVSMYKHDKHLKSKSLKCDVNFIHEVQSGILKVYDHFKDKQQ
jgi:hypothetical protein